jgi:hypothetical protein
MFLKRSSDQSDVLDSIIEKMAKKNQYTIMGQHAGDGGVFFGESPEEAVAEWIVAEQSWDSPAERKKALIKYKKEIIQDTKSKKYFTREEMKKFVEDPKKNPLGEERMGIHEIKNGVWEFGDYEIKLVHESFEDWLSGKKFVNLETKEKTSYDKLSKDQQEKIKKQYEEEVNK